MRLAKIHQRLTAPSTFQMVHHINSSLVFMHNRRNRSRRHALGGREKNSTRQLSRLCSFPSVCQWHSPSRPIEQVLIYFRCSVRAARNDESATPRFLRTRVKPRPAGISDATIQMDHNAVVLFTIDRLARSPRTTVRTRGTEKAPDP